FPPSASRDVYCWRSCFQSRRFWWVLPSWRSAPPRTGFAAGPHKTGTRLLATRAVIRKRLGVSAGMESRPPLRSTDEYHLHLRRDHRRGAGPTVVFGQAGNSRRLATLHKGVSEDLRNDRSRGHPVCSALLNSYR